jgi:hypothetical protein
LSLTGCSVFSPQKSDARILCKSLNAETSAANAAVSREREALNSIAQWSGGVASMGFPAFQPVAPNAQFPRAYQQQLNQVRDIWSGIRQRVSAGNHPKSAEIQVYLADLLSSWQTREQAIAELSNLLGQATQAIQSEPRVAGYMMGQVSTHPSVINTIYDKVRAYSPPVEKSASSVSELRVKYNLTDSDLR